MRQHGPKWNAKHDPSHADTAHDAKTERAHAGRKGGGEADSVYNPNEQADGSDYDNYDAAEHSVSLRHGVRQAPYQAQAGLTPTPNPHLTPTPDPHLAPTPNPHLTPT